MKIGDKVKHRATAFQIEGTIIGEVMPTNGEMLIAVEDSLTHFVHLFGNHSLDVIETKLVVATEPVAPPLPPPPPKMTLPFEIWVPIKAIPAAGANRRINAERIRAKWLTPVVYESLVQGHVDAEVEFHFLGGKSGDLDNLLKPTLDLLKGSVLRDDGQIVSIQARILENMNEAGFKVRLTAHGA